MRNKFDEQLTALNDMLIEMGALIETAIAASVEALIKQDKVLAKKTVEMDDLIDQKEKDIERLCLKLLLQQQPVARDLRLISSALKMITDMERIGDQAGDIAEITLHLNGRGHIENMDHIKQMAINTINMVTNSIDAFVNKDLQLANSVIAYDDVIDELFDTVKNDLVNMIKRDRDGGDIAIDLIMIAKYFERIGDHAVNIAEWVLFAITGEHKAK